MPSLISSIRIGMIRRCQALRPGYFRRRKKTALLVPFSRDRKLPPSPSKPTILYVFSPQNERATIYRSLFLFKTLLSQTFLSLFFIFLSGFVAIKKKYVSILAIFLLKAY